MGRRRPVSGVKYYLELGRECTCGPCWVCGDFPEQTGLCPCFDAGVAWVVKRQWETKNGGRSSPSVRGAGGGSDGSTETDGGRPATTTG